MNHKVRRYLVLLTVLVTLLLSFTALAETLQEQALPKNGTTQVFTKAKQIAPFEIKSSEGTYYLIKLVDVKAQETILTVFVHGGATVNIDVPLGKYELKYASGEKWYGYEQLFGPETQYNKAEGVFDFKIENGYISGYTITLYTVTNGNLQTKSIKPSDF